MKYGSKAVVSSLIVKFSEQLMVKITSLIVSIVLARILDVTDFGIIAILTIFINISSAVIEGGLSTSLIQKKEVNEIDYSTVFYTSLGLAILLYGILFFSSNFIADQYDDYALALYLKVIGIILFATPFNTVQFGYVYRHMLFKKLFLATLAASVISGVIGIIMANNGFRAWALVMQTILNSIITVIMLLVLVKWKPKLLFSKEKLKEHFSYGWKLLASSLLETLYNEMRSLIIGSKYSANDLAYYNRGDTYPKAVMTSLNTSIQTVMLPVLSAEQDNKERFKEVLRKSINLSSFVVFPAMAGLAAASESFVKIILTNKWIECVPYLQLACVIYAVQPITSCNLQAVKAIGRSDLYLTLDIIKIGLGLLSLIISAVAFKTPMAIAAVSAIYAPIQLMINIIPNKKLLDYSIQEQIQDIAVPFIMSVIMFIVVHTIGFLNIRLLTKFLLQIVVGVCIYICLGIVFRAPALYEIIRRIKNKK